ncbi:MAG: DEAD/DEAH box helicase [Casimicrobiaceae bacterium]
MTQSNGSRNGGARHPRSPLPRGSETHPHGRVRRLAAAAAQPPYPPKPRAPRPRAEGAAPLRQPPAAPRVAALFAAPKSAGGTVLAADAPTAVRTPPATSPQHVIQSFPKEPSAFAALGLRPAIVRAVHEHGYDTPTAIQREAIPVVLEGGDLLGGAQTGTGKTAGFVLPVLERLMAAREAGERVGPRETRALILAPTRELAAQVGESVRVYGKHLPLTSTVVFGGVGIHPQIDALRRGVDIVVATPGRLLDLAGQKAIDLRRVSILVLDEADRMLDMGFIHDIRKVLALLPARRQNLLFSATFSDEIKALADRLLDRPRMIEVARRNTTVEVVEQSVVEVDKAHKTKLLVHLIRERQWFQVLVFTRMKHGANRLAEQLTRAGISAMAIHGNKSQGARTRALAEFKSGALQALVATDIAARGIDIDQLPQVVNFELPNVPEDYVHRIGRTGRAGASGQALSLVTREELPLLRDIERFTKQSIPRVTVADFDPAAIAEPPAPSSDARDAQWRASGGRPRRGGGRSQGAPGAPRSVKPAPRRGSVHQG